MEAFNEMTVWDIVMIGIGILIFIFATFFHQDYKINKQHRKTMQKYNK
jgi:uncharacterized membrane protein YgaE (UPF0421/DUF939 family)